LRLIIHFYFWISIPCAVNISTYSRCHSNRVKNINWGAVFSWIVRVVQKSETA
jgi:hypothetical protein